ncbi:hypothetical protein ACKWTF_000562 [Chironomus riparius]
MSKLLLFLLRTYHHHQQCVHRVSIHLMWVIFLYLIQVWVKLIDIVSIKPIYLHFCVYFKTFIDRSLDLIYRIKLTYNTDMSLIFNRLQNVNSSIKMTTRTLENQFAFFFINDLCDVQSLHKF